MTAFTRCALFATTAVLCVASPAQAQTRSFDVPAQSLDRAVSALGRQADIQIVAVKKLTRGKSSRAIKGSMTAEQALAALLEGSGLTARRLRANSYTIVADPNVVGSVADAPARGQVASSMGEDVNEEGNENGVERRSSEVRSETIVVTGTRVRGAAPVGSPVVTIDRTSIEKSGANSVQQLLQALPQFFGGGPGETTLGATTRNGTGTDATYGSSVNLRGLGPSSTLVLIDGNRPALGGLGGAFADVSLIPLGAIDRVEVLTDGASAIYGADAVAGVVNIRLRNRFEGAETLLRTGTANGGMGDVQIGQIIGKKWNGGHLTLAYQFSQREALAAAKRAFATEDLRPFGGPDYRSLFAVPGTITAANGETFAIPSGQDGRDLSPDQLVAGTRNLGDRRAASDLVPRQRVHSAYAALEVDLTSSLLFRANVLAAQREYRKLALNEYLSVVSVPVTNPYYVDPIGTGQQVTVNYNFARDMGAPIDTGRVRGISSSASLEKTFGAWRLQLGGAYGRQEGRNDSLNIPNLARLAAAIGDTNPLTAFNVFGDGSANNPGTVADIRGGIRSQDTFESLSASLRVDGSIARLPGGNIRVAFGAEYRREHYQRYTVDDINTAIPVPSSLSVLPGPRHVRSAYAEILVPIVGRDNRVTGIDSLDISLAGRLEDYSDVGRTTNPKVGLRWETIPGIVLRGSYGTSFRAPAFDELIGPAISSYTTLRVPDPTSPTGTANVIALFGYSAGIKPEKATGWTIGLDLAPRAIPDLKASITYFDVRYRDRISSVSEDFLRFLSRPDLFAGVVTRSPSDELLSYYFSFPTFRNPFQFAPANIDAVLDGQIRNLSAVHQTGIDFDVGYSPDFAHGKADLGISGTHIFRIDRRLTPGTPAVDVVGTFGNPTSWRLRGRAGWSDGGFAATLFANYVGSSVNEVPALAERVSSWSTFDLSISQQFGSDLGGRGLKLGLSIINLFDRDPPYVNNRSNTSALAYDPEKANPFGRMISLQGSVSW
ncbi:MULTISPECIES: TonB-dependent receptor [unclassified Sphingomonas]|uniref:TonB-dependent receptor n=1 Tax=unclassified Sphingomonas TaxID=196159 RepID=UPI0009EABD51|nr:MULTISPECIES: TonB-dependent receptor [unclassified Sphingomonas]